ncbi:Asparagine synthase family protein [Tritrichomonas foetus]|uniref:Asparagine synthase family protein n=1 Tax=Tritrichomonas foetus TaxID=1144522 RepID=A0A1J4JEP8_9EUKA|nr:Asparagine synthase family protein [Tritrichomonas foetus]|eukprot:OHS97137.1 Asparagine synthase family protein [Tritrichomonas foetus]
MSLFNYVRMESKLFYRVELSSSESKYPFRDGFLNISFNNDESPYLSYISDENGFLIWKSLDIRANEVYKHLLSANELTIDTFNFTNYGFTLIFYDLKKRIFLFGKDRLGVSSLITTSDPLIISSHCLSGNEHPPGITILYEQNITSSISFPQYSRLNFVNNNITPEEAVHQMIEILLKTVKIDCPVMFSGGVDSTIIAGILGLAGATSVNLINFCASENAPDRTAARISLEELKTAFPNTQYHLLEFNGDTEKMLSKLNLMKNLLIPCEITEMNLNIAMTLYSSMEHVEGFVVHSGLGADELCCGYMRMKAESNADEEICEHLNRLWGRNGGRDDRVAMNLGKTCICPFLSKDFIDFALSLPVNMLIRPDLPRGEGEKWILRQVAVKLGLNSAAKRPKQAMQFGSKVAKANWRGTEKIPQS